MLIKNRSKPDLSFFFFVLPRAGHNQRSAAYHQTNTTVRWHGTRSSPAAGGGTRARDVDG
jgi:hypothetical protein